jgi:hypothetical protein
MYLSSFTLLILARIFRLSPASTICSVFRATTPHRAQPFVGGFEKSCGDGGGRKVAENVLLGVKPPVPIPLVPMQD